MPASVHSEDQSMMDVDVPEGVEPTDPHLLLNEKRIVVLPGASDTAASFQFANEGHTMGNVLRYAIMKNPLVEFCGYTIPHPSEAKMHLRIQTTDETTALEALDKGLTDMMDLCDVVTEKFTQSRNEFNADNQMQS
ncbi:DNA-directed RNA polymerase I and III subunit [Penicillium taxi]|uniref:DNA-directed RNA polymerase I and III subunit n=1 Tax=Penicillium taxi TaxID=168475 RepID=UPI0025459042|nr:DNA-directed RNA polymerase I and III subunit [Penicillium taxi]KAJ5902516.1 DNA-directed RNA polymerase I and III subunit [Penicillium taxi]